MLRSLRIQHFALIDAVQLDFQNGFTVFTGETGSGKSIILSATQLILGERADLSVLAPGAKKAIVEAIFDLPQSLLPFFEQHDLDYEPQTLIRRELAAEGKSRAFINDTPVSLQVLKLLTSNLLQIHSQYNTLELKSKTFQLQLVDVLLGLQEQQLDFARAFKSFQLKQKELEHMRAKYEQDCAQQDYNDFLLEELVALQLHDPKIQGLENEIERYANAAQLQEAQSALESLQDDNGPYAALYQRKLILDKVKHIDAQMAGFAERLAELLIELKELSRDALRSSTQDLDPSQLPALEALQDKINSALHKHKAHDIAALIDIQKQLSNQAQTLHEQQESLKNFDKELAVLQQQLWAAALALHQSRVVGVSALAAQLQQILDELKLPNTTLSFELEQTDQLNQNGCSDIEMLFSANLGHQPVPVERAASGGELSRLMLALQKMVSEKKALPTIIFDEIDTGVSGDVALKIGRLLNEMAQNGQCMAISHLPQVAAKAVHHFLVQKTVVNERMQTRVSALSQVERTQEIARLLSGEIISEAALANAVSLLADQ